MASGSYSKNYTSHFTLKTEWSSTSSASTNKSDITAKHKLVCGTYGALYISARSDNTCKVNGVTKTFSSPAISTSGGSTIPLGTTKYEVEHNTDGKKSVSASTVFNMRATINSTYVESITASGTMVLDNIPRYATSVQSLNTKTETTISMKWSSDSTVDYIWYSKDNGSNWTGVSITEGTSGSYSISGLSANTTYNIKTRVRRKDSQLTTDSSALSVTTYDYPHVTKVGTTDLTIGSSQTLTLYNPLSRSVTVRMYKGSTSGTQLYSGTTSGTSLTFTPTESTLYASIPSSQSGACVYSVIYGSASTKTTTGDYTYKIKGTEKPTLGTITYADTDTTVTAITGDSSKIVQNKSNLKVTFTSATAQNSATISKHTFELNGVTKTSTASKGTVDFGKIDSARSLTLKTTVTDSRGLTASTTQTITILEHSEPTAIVTLKRLNNYEDESYLTVDASISSINGKNTMTIKYRYKVSGGTYGEFTTIKDNTKYTLSLDKNNAYIFDIVVTDAFGATYNREHALGKGVFPLFIDVEKQALGMNTFPRAVNMFEVNGRIIESEKEFSIPTNVGTKTGWYLAMSGNITGSINKSYMIAIQQSYNGGSGILYLNIRCNGSTELILQRFHWITYTGISSSNVVVKLEGNNFYIYLKTTENFQQYYIKVLQEKCLNSWNFQQYKMYTPTYIDTVDEEPTGTNPVALCLPTTGGTVTGALTVEKNLNIKADGTNISYQQGGVPILRYNGNGITLLSGAGSIYLRPNGTTDDTGQVAIDTNGKITTPSGTVDIAPVELYHTKDGTTGTVKLSDNISNYKYLEILFGNSAKTVNSSVKVGTDRSGVALSFMVTTNGHMWVQTAELLLGTNTLTPNRCGDNDIDSTPAIAYSTTSTIYVYAVLGYK